jgi:predicted anti-sigma-YlaC factor YlaD
VTTRCAESFRLFEQVERAQREAQQAGCRDEEYGPYLAVFRVYTDHLKNCPDCRGWVKKLMAMV